MYVERSTLTEIKVIQGQEETQFYLHTVLRDEGDSGLKICLTDIEDVWEGELSEDDLDLRCARLKMDFKSYVEQTVAAFTRDKLKDVCFEYQLKALPSNRMQLVWKKCVTGDQIKIQLGSVSLEKSDNPSGQIRAIFMHCVSSMSELKNLIQDLESSCDRLAQERQNAVKRLDKCVSAKEEIEQDLYSKFAAVLNSKKERIRQLEDSGAESLHDDVNETLEPGPSKVVPKMTVQESKRTSLETTNSRGDSAVDTDSDSCSDAQTGKSKAKRARRVKVAPPVDDNSLNLGDEEDEEDSGNVVPAARRPRRQGPVKKQTPSKPTLPRVSSGKTASDSSRPGSASRRTSLRKSGSNNSDKSMDVDDLLDNI